MASGKAAAEKNAAMKLERVRVADLHFDPANARKHGERNLATIKASLARFGQQTPIVVDANNVVRKGNGTLAAAAALGWETIACVRTGLGGADAVAYAIADNKTAELAEWDFQVLSGQLAGLRDEGYDLGVTGFADFEIEPLLAAEWSPPAAGEMPGRDETGGEPGGDGLGQTQTPSEDHSHAVVFGREAWETVRQAVHAKRDEQGTPELTEAQCLELICANFLRG